MPVTDQTSNPKAVDSSLWFPSFSVLLSELENAPLSSDLPVPLAERVQNCHGWLLDTVNRFKPPNTTSKDALNSQAITVGEHKLSVKPELRELALKLSAAACLDEVQSYIIAERSIEHKIIAADGIFQGSHHELMLEYYIERQCLLKCTRQLFAHAVHVGSEVQQGKAVQNEVAQLLSDEEENKLLSILQDLLVLFPPENMDVDLFVLWAEETLLEVNLVLDILFLIYYESFSTCNVEKWKKLCLVYKGIISGSFNLGKLGVSAEALDYCYSAKVQMLLILVETLDLEGLLQMIHDEIPFRDNFIVFSPNDILEMDSQISSFDVFETKEAAPLVLTWAVFLCLITSTSGKGEQCELMEIDHVGYVRQAFDAGALSYFLEMLRSNVLKNSDGPVAGCRSILRTFMSALIASYEINIKAEDDTLQLIMTILCEIYRGEELLCSQFWDKDSIVDGPIRTLLCNLEVEFPCRIIELVGLLSALCGGSWPAECVYNFLDKSAGISSLFNVKNGFWVDKVSQVVETQVPLQVPGIEGLIIPRHTRGHIAKVIDDDVALVRWQYKQSGILLLLMRLAQKPDYDSNQEVLAILDLFSQLASSSMGVCFNLMNIGKTLFIQSGYDSAHDGTSWIDVVEILCNVVKKLSPNCDGVMLMSMGISILAKMLKCSPSHVSTMVLKMNIFDAMQTSLFNVESSGLSSGSWILPGRLAKMMLIDCEQNSGCPLTISVMDFTIHLLEVKAENDLVLALVMFCIQYIFVNHEHWKYKVKQDRWRVTLKVLELLKTSIISIPYFVKIGGTIHHIILSDSSIHNMLLRIVCTTSEDLKKLYVSRIFDLRDIEGRQLAICSVLDIFISIPSEIPEDDLFGASTFHQAMLSPSTKPIPVVAALTSLTCYISNPALQMGAVRVLSKLCAFPNPSQSYLAVNASFTIGNKQCLQLRRCIETLIHKKSVTNKDIVVAFVNFLTSAATYQPAFLAAILIAEDIKVDLDDTSIQKDLMSDASFKSLNSKCATLLLDKLLQYVQSSHDLMESNAPLVLSVLNFLKALWQGAPQYMDVVEHIRKSENFWTKLSEIVTVVTRLKASLPGNLTQMEAQKLAYQYRCQSAALEIIALEMFLAKKLLHAETFVKVNEKLSKGSSGGAGGSDALETANWSHLKNVLSSWSDSSLLGDLIKSSAVCTYNNDIYLRAKIASSLLAAHVIGKLSTGDAGNLAVSFTDHFNIFSEKLTTLPAFAELCDQYSRHGYSEGVKLKTLIFSDLYYHLQGELEGRSIHSGPFKDIYQFLVDSNVLCKYLKPDCDLSYKGNIALVYDLMHLRQDLGLNLWDYSEWKASKDTVETMLLHLQKFNSMLLLGASKYLAIRALIVVLTLARSQTKSETVNACRMSNDILVSSVDGVCQEFISTVESLVEVSGVSVEVVDFIAAQAELLLCLLRNINGSIPLSTCKIVLKTSGFGLKALAGYRHLIGKVDPAMKYLLMMLLLVTECNSYVSPVGSEADIGSVKEYGEVSNTYLGLLPILCNCCGIIQHQTLSVACIDKILNSFSTPTTWLPVIQKDLQLQDVILKIQDKRSYDNIPIILNFLLTIAQVRGGAEMLYGSGFLTSLRTLFSEIPDGVIYPDNDNEKHTVIDKRDKKAVYVWGLGLSVLTSMMYSLGESQIGADVVDKMTSYFINEKAYQIGYHLSAPDIPSDEHDKKRARAQKAQTHLAALRETEHTLMLLCALARHRNTWLKSTGGIGSELRERSIHLLTFISKGNHHHGDLHSRTAPIICLPLCKTEVDCCKKPSFVGSKRGWFALSPLGCITGPNMLTEPIKKMAVAIRDQTDKTTESASQSYFSDTVALQIYRIACLLLKFLCLEASDSARRAEELGFVDLHSIPEVPMPEILHGLQDQAIAIVTELCENDAKSRQIEPEIRDVCFLLLEITEMALHLELFVSQTCGIRPVLGRVEDFTKEIKMFFRATEGCSFLKPTVQQLKQIISFVYPGLLQTEGIL